MAVVYLLSEYTFCQFPCQSFGKIHSTSSGIQELETLPRAAPARPLINWYRSKVGALYF
jgi:hypothetical protein